jgi:hypothetical protein
VTDELGVVSNWFPDESGSSEVDDYDYDDDVAESGGDVAKPDLSHVVRRYEEAAFDPGLRAEFDSQDAEVAEVLSGDDGYEDELEDEPSEPGVETLSALTPDAAIDALMGLPADQQAAGPPYLQERDPEAAQVLLGAAAGSARGW